MKILRTTDRNFRYDFGKVFKRNFEVSEAIQKSVFNILDDIKRIGDQALQKYTHKYDFFDLSGKNMEVSAKEFNTALKDLSKEDKAALETAAERIEDYFKQQKIEKIKRQKKRRSRRSKQKMLDEEIHAQAKLRSRWSSEPLLSLLEPC